MSEHKPGASFTSSTPLEKAIDDSDDYEQHRKTFIRISQGLINRGRCRIEDFKEMGGWMFSPKYRNRGVYFTYFGGTKQANKIYHFARKTPFIISDLIGDG